MNQTEDMDYASLSGPDLLAVLKDDASKWAKAFVQIHAKYGDLEIIDEDSMRTWFANAIESSWDHRMRELHD